MIFITQGNYTREAVKGLLAKPEDRSAELARLAEKAGGKLVGYYMTFGESDFVIIIDAPSEKAMTAILLVAAASGGVANLRTMLAMSTSDAKQSMATDGQFAAAYRAPGG